MKKLLAVLVFAHFGTMTFAQMNIFPASGNVGIGTTTPVHNLHIVGITGAPSIKLENQSPLFGCQLIMADNITPVVSDWRFKTSSGGQFRIRDEKKSADVLIFEQRAVTLAPTALYLKSTGEFGIGTSTPTQKLDVAGTVRVQSLTTGSLSLQLVSADATGVLSGFPFPATPNPNVFLNGAGGFTIPQGGDADWYDIITNLPSTNIYNNIYTFGNVGVGTSTPSQKLDVAGKVRVQNLSPLLSPPQLVSADAAGILSSLTFPSPSNANVFLNGAGGFTTPPAGSDADWYSIATNQAPLTMGTNIYTTGNVGIGTNSPYKRLHVSSIGNNDGIKITPGGLSNTGSCIYLDASGTGVDGRDFLIQTIGYGNELAGIGQYRGQLVFRDIDNFYDIVRMDGRSDHLNVGIGDITPDKDYKLDVNGQVHTWGDLYCNGIWYPSDSTLKKNISNINNALGTIGQLHPRSFDYRVSEFPYLHLPAEHSFGFISQDVKIVLPSLLDSIHFAPVRAADSANTILYAGGSFLSLNYTGLIPFAIKGIQELDSKVTTLSASAVSKSCSLNVNYLTKSTGTSMVCNSQIYDNGVCVGVGTTTVPPDYRMVVEGKLGARDVFVACAGWPDYVFNSTHKMRPLDELEAFLSANKHLPGIPSATEIERAGGVNLGEMQTRQMEKIEELYKYIIEMNKSLQHLSLENKELKERLHQMENK